MKIGINARFLSKPFTGIGQYTKNLLAALAEIDKKNEYVVVVPEVGRVHPFSPSGLRRTKSSLSALYACLGENFQLLALPEIHFGSAGFKKTWWEQVQVPRLFRKMGIDLAHFFYPAHPWHPVLFKTLVTVHDTIPWERDAYRRRFLTRLYQDRVFRSLPQVGGIITVSQTVKKKFNSLNLSLHNKIHVIYNAPSPIFSQADRVAALEKTRAKYHLRKPFLLYVGGYDVRKNVDRLLAAYRQSVAAKCIDLICIGGKALDNQLYGSFDLCREKKSGIMKPSGEVVATGFVSEEELRQLYKLCLAFVTVSEEEGFNIPVVEAATCFAPLVISDIPVHRETVGDQALYCDPCSIESISQALQKVVVDPNLRRQLSTKSGVVSGRYSWQESAKQVLALYQSLRF